MANPAEVEFGQYMLDDKGIRTKARLFRKSSNLLWSDVISFQALETRTFRDMDQKKQELHGIEIFDHAIEIETRSGTVVIREADAGGGLWNILERLRTNSPGVDKTPVADDEQE
jgi:hypothetical protein